MISNRRAKTFALLALLILVAAPYAAPVASAGSDQVANVGQNVSVSGAASTCSGCTISAYSWNWGESNTSSGVSATRSYGASGSYTVTLTVVANDSSVASDTLTVTVQSSDSTSPTITHTNITSWTQNQSLALTATVTDNVGVSTATLYYKSESAAAYSSTTMSASGSTYSGTIPSSSTNESNALYYITATDTASPANTQSHGSSSSPVNVSLSATDTTAPSTTLTSVSSDTASPYWVTTSNATTGNAYVVLSGESGMSCRMGQSNSNYSGMTVGYVDCTMSGSTANCSATLGDSNYSRFVACKDSGGNEQNTSQTLNVSFGVDSVAPTVISSINATEGTTKISLSWVAPTDATSGVSVQKIFRSTGTCTNYSSVQSAYSSTATSYNDTSVSAGTAYCYYIVGQDTAGNLQGTYTATTAINYGAPAISAISLTLSGSTLTLAATTNENASCRYSASNLNYANMTSNFTTTGATSHSTTGSGSSGTVTYYVSCADTAGNNMTTANSTSYTFSSSTTTTTTTSSSGSGGGSVSGDTSASSASEAQTFALGTGTTSTTVSALRRVSYVPATALSTFTLKFTNNGTSPTGPIVIKERIPERVANSTDQLTFSLAPTRFENGSIIAVWEIPGGIAAGESITITYSVKKQATLLAGFETTVAPLTTAPVQQPATPQQQQPTQPPAPSPQQQPAEKPASAASSAPAPALPPETPQMGLLGSLAGIFAILLAIAVVGGAVFIFIKLRKKKGL